MNILGIDPGFSSLGWCIASVEGGVINPVQVGVILTEKSISKIGVRSSEDNIRRANLIWNSLASLNAMHKPKLIATETMSWPRNAGVVAKMGIAWGVIASLSACYGIPVVQASPVDIKKAVVGTGTASKEAMIEAIKNRYPSISWPANISIHEHAADAVGSIIACKDSELMRMLCQAA